MIAQNTRIGPKIPKFFASKTGIRLFCAQDLAGDQPTENTQKMMKRSLFFAGQNELELMRSYFDVFQFNQMPMSPQNHNNFVTILFVKKGIPSARHI
jgi:hypothetical protein